MKAAEAEEEAVEVAATKPLVAAAVQVAVADVEEVADRCRRPTTRGASFDPAEVADGG